MGQATSNPQTIMDRQAAAANALAALAKWPHCNHKQATTVHDFDETVREQIDKGRAPAFTWSDYHEQPDSYAWQIYCETIAKVLNASEDEIAERLVDAEERLANGTGKPTATDGSKGQWRAYVTSQIKTYDWLLNGNGGDT